MGTVPVVHSDIDDVSAGAVCIPCQPVGQLEPTLWMEYSDVLRKKGMDEEADYAKNHAEFLDLTVFFEDRNFLMRYSYFTPEDMAWSCRQKYKDCDTDLDLEATARELHTSDRRLRLKNSRNTWTITIWK